MVSGSDDQVSAGMFAVADIGAGPVDAGIVVGRWEWLAFPGLSGRAFRAKVDTGARTSSLHAEEVILVDPSGRRAMSGLPEGSLSGGLRKLVSDGCGKAPSGWMVEFSLPCGAQALRPLVDVVDVRSSNGSVSSRPLVALTSSVAGLSFTVRYTLADRSPMRSPVLLGRDALSGRFVVDASSYRRFARPPGSVPWRKELTG